MPFGVAFSPVHIAIVTARNGQAEIKLIRTLRHWDDYADLMLFPGGVEKAEALKAFGPHIFFGDQDTHLQLAAKHVPSAEVPYRMPSPLNVARRGDRAGEQVASARDSGVAISRRRLGRRWLTQQSRALSLDWQAESRPVPLRRRIPNDRDVRLYC